MQYEVSGSDKSKGQKLERSVGLELSVTTQLKNKGLLLFVVMMK